MTWKVWVAVRVTGGGIILSGDVTLPFTPMLGLKLRYPDPTVGGTFDINVDLIIWDFTTNSGVLDAFAAYGDDMAERVAATLVNAGFKRESGRK